MIAKKITNKKEFMSKLLASESFGSFFVEQATIDTFNTFTIDGRTHKDFYKNDADYTDDSAFDEYSTWSLLRPVCYDLIKGKRTPLGFKFVFLCDKETKSKIIEQSSAGLTPDQVNLGLNIRFSAGNVIITTGCAYSVFTLDKTIEKAWDEYIPSFLTSFGIEYDDYE